MTDAHRTAYVYIRNTFAGTWKETDAVLLLMTG